MTASDGGAVGQWLDDGLEQYQIKTVRFVRAKPGKRLLIVQVNKTEETEEMRNAPSR